MAFKVKAESGGDFSDAPPAGNHPAVLVALIDMGTQRVEYAGEVDWKRKIYLAWELVTEKRTGTKDVNHVVGRDYTYSFTPKALLRGIVEKWRGKTFNEGEEFELSKLLGKPCLLTIIQKTSEKGNAFAKIEGVSAVPKGMKVDPPQRKPFEWSIDSTDPIPDWIPYLYGRNLSEHIAESTEKTGKVPPGKAAEPEHVGAGVGSENDEDSIPF